MIKTLMMILLLMLTSSFTLAQDATETPVESEPLTWEAAAHVRFAHFAPGAFPSIDIYLNGESTDIVAFEYGSVTAWMTLPAGTYSVIAPSTGEPLNVDAIGPVEFNLPPQTWTTVVAVGSMQTGSFLFQTFQEDTNDIVSGTARLTFFQAIEDAESLTINRDGVPYTTGLTFLNHMVVDEDADTYAFELVTGGDAPETLSEAVEVDLNESSSYLIAAIGTQDADDETATELVIIETDYAEYALGLGMLEAPGTVIQAISGSTLMGDLGQAIEMAGLTETLAGEGPFTVFAPAEFDITTLEGMDAAAIADILKYHVVEGELMGGDIIAAQTITTLQGADLTVRVEGDTIFVNDAQVLSLNIPATNGVVHLISSVITP